MNDKIGFKPFYEEINSILNNCSINELKNIITTMAEKVSPLDRKSFIERISKYRQKLPERFPDVTELIQDIEDLRQEIQDTADDAEYDDYYNDEDYLGPFEKYVLSLSKLYDQTAIAFDFGKIKLAREAYEKLFSIFEIEDEFGRSIHTHDLEEVDIDETRARYIRSVYLTESASNRVKIVIDKMSSMTDICYKNPMLQEIIEIAPDPLPDFQEFLTNWIDWTKKQPGDKYDAWLREGIKISQGVKGLEQLAKTEGMNRPRAYYDWVELLIEQNDFKGVVKAAEYALSKLPEKMPIRAAIADYLAHAAIEIGDKKTAQNAHWLSFVAKPTINKLIGIYQHTANNKINNVIRDASQIINEHLNRKTDDKIDDWEKDSVEMPVHVEKPLLLHSYLLGNNICDAFHLAKKSEILGWSYNNCQPFFIAFTFIAATTRQLSSAPDILRRFWNYAIVTSIKDNWDCDNDDITNNLESLYEDRLLKINKQNIDNCLPWCINTAKKRINEIVSNTKRRVYENAAILTAVCVEVLKYTGETKKAENFYTTIKQNYPRHSAFQQELKKIFD